MINAGADNLSNTSTLTISELFPKMLELGYSSATTDIDVIYYTNVSYYTSIDLTLNKDLETETLYWTFTVEEEDLVGIFDSSN